jgi:hypothetical protein
MTATSTVNGSASADALISGELVDLLVESVVLPKGPVDRAAVVGNILSELCAAVEWLHGPELTLDAAGRELASLRQLVAAGQDHQRRMKTLGPVGAPVGGRR